MQEMDGLDDETANDIAVADDHLRQPLFERPDPDLLNAISSLFKTEIGPVKTTVDNLQQQMANMSLSVDNRLKEMHTRIERLEQRDGGATTPKSEASWATQKTALEQELAEFKKHWNGAGPAHTASEERDRTAVIGGLGGFPNVDATKDWVSNTLWELYGPWPQEMYTKSESNGMLFAKFNTSIERDTAVRLLRGAKCEENGKQIWAKADKPVEIRVLQSLVFGTKHALGKYYEKNQIWGDIAEPEKSGELWLGNDKLFTAKVTDNHITITFSENCESWLVHDDYPEFQAIIVAVKTKLASAKGGGKSKSKSKVGKGMGKGPF